MELTLSRIAKAVGGRLSGYDCIVTSVSTDSRDIPKGCLFICLEGEKFDGHDFVSQAAHNGAAAVLVRKKVDSRIPVITVKDTGKALLDLAGYYRGTLDNLTVVGLTGSVGKTTTKEMTYAVLAEQFKTIKTEGNLNNEIGMPKTLLRLKDDTEAAVIEMGMNHFGEIERMTKSSRPDIGIITNIGVSHIEYLGSRDGILKAKLEILEGMKKGAPLILNGDNDKLVTVREPDYKLVFFGIENPNVDFRAKDIEEKNGFTSFTVEFYGASQRVTVPTVGIHNVYDALAAFAVGYEMRMEPRKIAAGLKSFVPSGMRQRIKKVGGITVIEDCYNASPDSQKAALDVLSSFKSNRRIAVLGDMLELGKYSDVAHENVGKYTENKNIDILFTYGAKAKHIAEGAKGFVDEIKSFDDKTELTKALLETLKDGDAVLFKASRGMKLEDVINSLYREWEE